MKEEDKLRKELGMENPFRVPEDYFEGFTSQLMSRLPEKLEIKKPRKGAPEVPSRIELLYTVLQTVA